MHWAGASWAAGTTDGTRALRGVWGSGPSDVWAVGDGGGVLRWNGTVWAPVDSGTDLDLYAVWGSGPGNLWVAGQKGTILRYKP